MIRVEDTGDGKRKFLISIGLRGMEAYPQANPQTIGFLAKDITNPFYALMVKEAELALASRGFEILDTDGKKNKVSILAARG